MFNLEQAIAGWRRHMRGRGIGSAEALDELEDHLREEIERQVRSGMSVEDAYEMAAGCIGGPEELNHEFGKLQASKRWPVFYRSCFLTFIAGVFCINVLVLFEYELAALERTAGVSALLAICFYMLLVPRLLQSLSKAAFARLAGVIKTGGHVIWLWPLWALLEALETIHTGMGIVPSTVLWCLMSAIALTVIVYGMLADTGNLGGFGSVEPLGGPRPAPFSPVPAGAPGAEDALGPHEPFNETVQQVFELARDEARRMGHDFVGTEHVLLGLLNRAEASFGSMLRKLNVDRDAVRVEMERRIHGTSAGSRQSTIAITPKARKALRLAARQAQLLHRPRITAEDIFLGLLLEGRGMAAIVLNNIGIGLEKARKAQASEPGPKHPW